MLKPLTVDYNKLLKILQVMRIPSASWEISYLPPEKPVKKQQLELDMEQ